MLAPVPHQSAWTNWLQSARLLINASPQQIGSVALTGQGAAIAATTIDTPRLTTARYRITYYARITRAASTNSSLTVTLSWTDGAVTCSGSFAAITGNTTATVESDSVMVLADVDTTITYATAYVSVGGTSMQYALDVTVERLP